MATIKPSHLSILKELAKRPNSFVLATHINSLNKGTKLRDMRIAGLVEYGRNEGHSFYGYKITEAGIIALVGDVKP